jgi:uncharacterized protein (TIGR02145 family)
MKNNIAIFLGSLLILISSCKKDKVKLPTLTTTNVGNITSSLASSGGSISNDGGANVTQRGVVWSTSPNPTLTNNSTSDGNGTGSFKSNLSGLSVNTTYFVRAYATNSAGTAYGNQQSFTAIYSPSQHTCGGSNVHNPNLTYGNMTDQEGNEYKTIVIGTQEWMAENLKVEIYRNEEPILNVTDNIQWNNLTTGAWAFYNNDIQYECPYGKLYNWYAVNDPRHLCPTGWHEPTDAEWTSLTDYLGGETIAGDKMKTSGFQYWNNYNQVANNEIGFSGLPGGFRNGNGRYDIVGNGGYWWSSSEISSTGAYFRNLSYEGNVNRLGYSKKVGFSVRCIKD